MSARTITALPAPGDDAPLASAQDHVLRAAEELRRYARANTGDRDIVKAAVLAVEAAVVHLSDARRVHVRRFAR